MQCYKYRFKPHFGLSSGTEHFNIGLFRHTVLRYFRFSKKIKNNIHLYFLIQHKIIDPNKETSNNTNRLVFFFFFFLLQTQIV